MRIETTEKEIRYYVDLEQEKYAYAKECEEGKIEYGLETISEANIANCEKQEEYNAILEKTKKEIKIVVYAVILIGTVIATIITSKRLELVPAFLFHFSIMLSTGYTAATLATIFCYYLTTRHSKRKITASRMMYNYLDKNQKLPKSFSEFKKCSKYVRGCKAVRESIYGVLRDFMDELLELRIQISYLFLMFLLIPQNITQLILYFTCWIICYWFLEKFLIEKIKKIYNSVIEFLIQTVKTSKRQVKENDFKMAFYAAREWIKEVYPEWYKIEEDIFQDE